MSEPTGRIVEPRVCERGGRRWLSYADLDYPRIAHGMVVFKQAAPGSDYPAWLRLASRELVSRVSPEPAHVAIPHQVHSGHVIDVDTVDEGMMVGDGVVTGRPLTAIGVSVSDCIPLFAVSVGGGVVGIAHCGWRGIAGGVVERFLQVLRGKSAEPEKTAFILGAAIGTCCYEVGDDLLSRFLPEEVRKYSRRTDTGTFFDLKSVVASRLTAGGCSADKI